MHQANPGASVVVLGAAMGPEHAEEVVKAGAEAVLDKVECIPTIAEEVRRRLADEAPPRQLETAPTTSVCWAPIDSDPRRIPWSMMPSRNPAMRRQKHAAMNA